MKICNLSFDYLMVKYLGIVFERKSYTSKTDCIDKKGIAFVFVVNDRWWLFKYNSWTGMTTIVEWKKIIFYCWLKLSECFDFLIF